MCNACLQCKHFPAVRKVAQQEVGEVIFGGLPAVVQCRPLKLNGKPVLKGRRRLDAAVEAEGLVWLRSGPGKGRLPQRHCDDLVLVTVQVIL